MSGNPLCSDEQLARLQAHVQRAYETVPYYRNLYDEAGVSPADLKSYEDLLRFPTIDKQAIIAAQQADPPLGSIVNEHAEPPAHIYCNAGSEYLYYSPSDFDSIVQMFSEQFATLGVRAGDIVDISSTFHWVMAGTIMNPAMRRLGASVIAGGPGMSELRMKIMRETGVTAIEIFTPYAEELASRFTQYGIDPVADLGVRLLIIGGELRSKDSKAKLEASWGGVAAREFYGVSEAGMVACECFEGGDGMHLSSYAVLEIVDPDTGRHVAPGAPGEVVTTELYRDTQPFIRYRSGDITEGMIFEECVCGRTTPRLKRIIGRNSDMVRVKGQFLSPAVMDQIVLSRPEIARWQVVLRRSARTDEMLLRLRPRDGATGLSPSVAEQIVSEIKGVVGVTCAAEIVSAEVLADDAAKVCDERTY